MLTSSRGLHWVAGRDSAPRRFSTALLALHRCPCAPHWHVSTSFSPRARSETVLCSAAGWPGSP
eukprot:1384048-Rhodomonas_salina.1